MGYELVALLYEENMKIERYYAQPSKDTFSIIPIANLVQKYLSESSLSVDPFARNCQLATITNDLNPLTDAEYHLDALSFLSLLKDGGVKADLVLCDPPYSLRQIKECYDGVGLKISQRESQYFYGDVRNAIDKIVAPGGKVISFGWNSIGMGKKRGYKILEILLVCHARAHNDTICVVDQKPNGRKS